MGYKSKFLTGHYLIELTKEFIEKYENEYHIDGFNISSKYETKGHYDIIDDLMDIAENESYPVWAVILHEDGIVDRINLSQNTNKRIINEV